MLSVVRLDVRLRLVVASLYLFEHADKQLVDLVVQDGRHLDELTTIIAGQLGEF